MTVCWDREAILLEGECGVEEAETLLELLLAHSTAAVDWSRCRGAHTAVVQVLLAAHRPLQGVPEEEGLHRWIMPALASATARAGRKSSPGK